MLRETMPTCCRRCKPRSAAWWVRHDSQAASTWRACSAQSLLPAVARASQGTPLDWMHQGPPAASTCRARCTEHRLPAVAGAGREARNERLELGGAPLPLVQLATPSVGDDDVRVLGGDCSGRGAHSVVPLRVPNAERVLDRPACGRRELPPASNLLLADPARLDGATPRRNAHPEVLCQLVGGVLDGDAGERGRVRRGAAAHRLHGDRLAAHEIRVCGGPVEDWAEDREACRNR
mmetsp:Transcript_71230/g.159455  ORF Transcript_71230/g.159455 Transcript_71230/m.159455 type:complete len:235 (-) Transcript_71230:136-840(-)